MSEIVDDIHDVVLRIVAILINKDVKVVEVSGLARIIAVECNWVELGQDLRGQESNIKNVEDNFEIIILLEYGESEVA